MKSQSDKRIALVTEAFHPNVGGQEVRFLELGEMFAAAGWQVDVLTIACAPGLPKFEIFRGLRVHRLVEDPGYIRPNSLLRRRVSTILRFSLSAARYLKREKFQVALFNQWPILPQILVGRPSGTLTVIDWCEHRGGLFWRTVNRILSRAPHKHICVSDELKRLINTRYGASPIESIPSGITRSLYRPDAKKQGVLYFGRLVAHKHPELAIEAMAHARRAGLAERLIVAGGGPMLEGLRTMYGQLDWLQIRGPVSEDEKRRLFARSRLLLLPSEREGFPRAVAEAMASGTPVLTTRCSDNGTVAVVEQYGCGVVGELDTASLSNALTSVLGSPRKWEELSDAGIRRSVELDWSSLYTRLEGFLTCDRL